MAQSDSLCVYCRRQPEDPMWRPFCSERCRLADLGRWLSEGYRVPAHETGLPDEVPEDDKND